MIALNLLLPLILKLGLAVTVLGAIGYGFITIKNVGAVEAREVMLTEIIERKNEVIDTQHNLTLQASDEADRARQDLLELSNVEREKEIIIKTVEVENCNLDSALPPDVLD